MKVFYLPPSPGCKSATTAVLRQQKQHTDLDFGRFFTMLLFVLNADDGLL